MAKCRYCGSEYFSDADRCYACGQHLEQASQHPGGLGRRKMYVSLGIALASIGMIVATYAAHRAIVPDGAIGWPPPVGIDWNGLILFALFVLSVGVGIVAFGLLGLETALWEIRDGKSPSDRRSAAMIALGTSALVFEMGYVVVAMVYDLPLSWEIPSALLAWTMVLITMGVLRLPSSLFADEEHKSTTRRGRQKKGWAVLTVGMAIEFFPPVLSAREYTLLPFFTLLLGIVVVIAGFGIISGPMGRPWIPGKARSRA